MKLIKAWKARKKRREAARELVRLLQREDEVIRATMRELAAVAEDCV